MSVHKAKAREYQLLVARNFLRNISLDGTHEDTALRIFNRPGLDLKFSATAEKTRQKLDADNARPSETAEGLCTPAANLELEFITGNDENAVNSRTDPPEIQVESPKSPMRGIEVDDFPELTCDPNEFSAKFRGTKRSLDLSPGQEKHKLADRLKKGDSSPVLAISGSKRLTWKRSHHKQMSLKESNNEKKKLEISKSLSKDSKSKLQKAVLRKTSLKGSSEGMNIFRKISNFLSPPSDVGMTSRNSSSNVSAASYDSNRSEDSVSVKSMSSQTTSRGELRFLTSLKSFSLKNDRICLLSSTYIPLVVYSVLPYERSEQIQRQRELADLKKSQQKGFSETDGLKPFELADEEEISYAELLVPYGSIIANVKGRKHYSDDSEERVPKLRNQQVSFLQSRSSSCEPTPSPSSPMKVAELQLKGFDEETDEEECPFAKTYHFGDKLATTSSYYDPNLLDNPEFGPGQHKTTLSFSGYITSIFDYVEASELKKEENESFRQKFAHVNLTCSKFKSIKREMRRIMLDLGIDVLTLAQSYVYFEKIVLKGLINKANRKLVASVCLIIAAKLNDSKGEDLESIFTKIESTFRVSRKEFIPYEFPVAVALDFSLHLPDWEIFPHYQKLVWAGC